MTSAPILMPSGSPGGRFVLPLTGLSIGALYLVTRHPAAPELLRAVIGILGLGFLPGLALTLWVERRFGVWSSWVLPLALSPVLVSLAGLVAARLGYTPQALASWIVLVSAAAVTFAPASGRELEDREVSLDIPEFLRARNDRTQVVLLASAVLAVVAVPLLLREWLHAWGPPLFHADVIRELSLSIPPHDPLLAGFNLRGAWAFDLYLDMLVETTGMGTGVLLVGGSVIVAFCLVFSSYELLRGLRLPHTESLWGTVFLFLSLGALFWLVDPAVRKITGVSGAWTAAGVWERFAVLAPPASDKLTVGFPPAGALFLEPFLVPSPAAWGLLYAALFAASVIRAVDGGGVRPWVRTGAAAAGLLLFHPVAAALTLGTGALLAPVMWLAGGMAPWRSPGRRFLGLWATPALAVALTWPYLEAISAYGGVRSLASFGIVPARTAFLFLLTAPQLLLALVLWLRFLRGEEVHRVTWAVWGLLVFLAVQVVGFHGEESATSPLLVLHLFLAMTAGAVVPALWRGSPRWLKPLTAVVLLTLLVPRTALGVRAYLTAEDPRDLRPEAVETVAWIATRTPADAVVVDYAPWLSLRAGRASLLGSRDHVTVRGYEGKNVTLRRLATGALILGKPLDESPVLASLRDLGRPLYLVHHLPTRVPPPRGSDLVFANDVFEVYRVNLPETGP